MTPSEVPSALTTVDAAVARLENIKLNDPDFYEEKMRGLREAILAGKSISVDPQIELSADEASQAVDLLTVEEQEENPSQVITKGIRAEAAEVARMDRAEGVVEQLLQLSKSDRESYKNRRQELDMYLQFGTNESAYEGLFEGLKPEELQYIATRLTPHKR